VRHSLMAVSEDQVEVRRRSKPRRLRWLVIALASGLVLAAAIVAYLLGVFTRNASPYEALDAYTSAVTTGDRGALEAAIADCPVPGLMEALIPRKDESHGSTEEVPGRAPGASDQDGR
jgi:hypothetical protein